MLQILKMVIPASSLDVIWEVRYNDKDILIPDVTAAVFGLSLLKKC